MSIPGSLVQKSTMVVVPPLRATQVVSYPALVVTPSVFNASKCEWLSTPPGSTYLPAASITVSASTSIWLAIIDIFFIFDKNICCKLIGRSDDSSVFYESFHLIYPPNRFIYFLSNFRIVCSNTFTLFSTSDHSVHS